MKLIARTPMNFGGPIKKGAMFEASAAQAQSLIYHGMATAAEPAAAVNAEPMAETTSESEQKPIKAKRAKE